jgi:hypothetical protein
VLSKLSQPSTVDLPMRIVEASVPGASVDTSYFRVSRTGTAKVVPVGPNSTAVSRTGWG